MTAFFYYERNHANQWIPKIAYEDPKLLQSSGIDQKRQISAVIPIAGVTKMDSKGLEWCITTFPVDEKGNVDDPR